MMRKLSFIILLILFILSSTFIVSAGTIEKRVTLIGGGQVNVDLKFSVSDVEFTDDYSQVLARDSYVCDLNDYLSDRIITNVVFNLDGEYYYNGGSVGSPKITVDKEVFDALERVVKKNSSNTITYSLNTIYTTLKFGDHSVSCTKYSSFKNQEFGIVYCPMGAYLTWGNYPSINEKLDYWSGFFDDRIDFSTVNVNSGVGGDDGKRPFAIVCKPSSDGIKCLGLVTGVRGDLRIMFTYKDVRMEVDPTNLTFVNQLKFNGWICLPNGTCARRVYTDVVVSADELKGAGIDSSLLDSGSSDFYDEVLSVADEYNLHSVNDSTIRVSIENPGIIYSMDQLMLSFELVNKGDFPVQILGVDLSTDNGPLDFDDVLRSLLVDNGSVVLEPNESIDALLLVKESPCDLINNGIDQMLLNIRLLPRTINCGENNEVGVDYSFNIDENAKINYTIKKVYPIDDFFIVSTQPRTNKNMRIDLHVGDQLIAGKRTVTKTIMKIPITNKKFFKALLRLNINELRGDYVDVGVYSVIKDFDPERVTWFRQPRRNDLLDEKRIDKVGLINFDVTKALEDKAHGLVLQSLENTDSEVIMSALESEEKPVILLLTEGESTLKDVCR